MKIRDAVVLGCLGLGIATIATADSNIDSVNKWAWGENVGWLNWRDANGGTQGVEVLNDHLEGFIWAENVGWINVGNGGGPYANTDNTNFGVNIDPATGNLSGFAWGENIGWVNFEGGALASPAQPAQLDFANNRFRGFAWGENIGWINLDDPINFVEVLDNACLFDFNGDGQVDGADFGTFGAAFGSMTGDPNYNPQADADGNGSIDGADFGAFGAEFGRTDCLD
jgi:hypothetical protein